MLYTALNKVGDKGGLDVPTINRLGRDRLLDLVPEEQLMKVKSPEAARTLLQRIYATDRDTPSPDHRDVDDQALIYRLAETSYGKAETWGVSTLRTLESSIVSQLPAQFLSALSPDTVKNSMDTLRDVGDLRSLSYDLDRLISNSVSYLDRFWKPAPSKKCRGRVSGFPRWR